MKSKGGEKLSEHPVQPSQNKKNALTSERSLTVAVALVTPAAEYCIWESKGLAAMGPKFLPLFSERLTFVFS